MLTFDRQYCRVVMILKMTLKESVALVLRQPVDMPLGGPV
jgi:hypothetical protein